MLPISWRLVIQFRTYTRWSLPAPYGCSRWAHRTTFPNVTYSKCDVISKTLYPLWQACILYTAVKLSLELKIHWHLSDSNVDIGFSVKIILLNDWNGKWNFSRCFVWVRNLVSDIKGRTWTESVVEHGAEQNTWIEEESNNKSLEKISQWGVS
jgi:hypothetical protein